ncbi:iron-containing alcohol dehydrogenase [Muribaculaceae bacterium Isolate-113 (HZI)]|nr:iron-containing alcohol dehydrogenase [Muribaculaceae bacterium Isolate-114 (HZI)]ROT19332.1 iron-containing alcohol dehydrogenase [Muribaculaceae bacterium Isolate-113 (HZI)]
MIDFNARIKDALALASDTKVFQFGEDILKHAPDLFMENFPGKKALIVADGNTWGAAGEKVWSYFKGAGIECRKHLFGMEEFHADSIYSDEIGAELDEFPSIPVAVGSGVINDLCKLAAFRHNVPYMVVATAASVDGYSSSGASITVDGAKMTIECKAPKVILADTNVLASAPKEMTAAGYADLAAKIPAGGEWMIADLFGTEPIVPEAWKILYEILPEMIADPEGIAAGNPESVGILFAGLTLSGIAMQVAHSSRPASCAEHLYSHWLDMTGHTFNGKLQSHGFQVGVGTLTTCAFFDELLKMDLSEIDVEACVEKWPALEEEQRRAREIFKDFPVSELGYTEITKKYNDKETVRRQLELIKNNWHEFKKELRKQVYSFDKMQNMFSIAGAPTCPEDIGVTRNQMRYLTDFVQLMRWRINMLDLAKRGCFYDRLVDGVFGKGGVWEC